MDIKALTIWVGKEDIGSLFYAMAKCKAQQSIRSIKVQLWYFILQSH